MTPKEITDMMINADYFSQWLGIELVDMNQGSCILKMKIRKDMLNGFGIAHGGVSYSLADSALAFASNSHGRKAVSIETSISHTESLKENDEIMAEANEEKCSEKIGIYSIKISKVSDGTVVALFKGTVYRTSQKWLIS